MSKVAFGFAPDPKQVPIDNILPSRRPPDGLTYTRKYKHIVSSIVVTDRHIGASP